MNNITFGQTNYTKKPESRNYTPEERYLLTTRNRKEADEFYSSRNNNRTQKSTQRETTKQPRLNPIQKAGIFLGLLAASAGATTAAVLNNNADKDSKSAEPTTSICETSEYNFDAPVFSEPNIQSIVIDYEDENSTQETSAEEESETTEEVTEPETEAPTKAQTKTTASSSIGLPDELISKLDGRLGSGFCQKVSDIAGRLNCETKDLIGLMQSESQVNPRAYNDNGGATGLIQFMPSTANELGTTIWDLMEMSAIDQLDYVEKFFKMNLDMFGFEPDQKINAGDLYALTFLPARAKRNTLCSQWDSLSWAYWANSGLDINGDGEITKTDLYNRIMGCYDDLL